MDKTYTVILCSHTDTFKYYGCKEPSSENGVIRFIAGNGAEVRSNIKNRIVIEEK